MQSSRIVLQPHPKKPLMYFILFPFRVIGGILFVIFGLLIMLVFKAYIGIIWLATMGIGYLLIEYIKQNFWSNVENSPVMILAIPVGIIIWIGVAMVLGYIVLGIDKITGISKIASSFFDTACEWSEKYIFEDIYKINYREIYGDDFPKPTYEMFGMKDENYFAYNRRFSLNEFISIIGMFTALAVGCALAYFLPIKKGEVSTLNLLGCVDINQLNCSMQ